MKEKLKLKSTCKTSFIIRVIERLNKKLIFG